MTSAVERPSPGRPIVTREDCERRVNMYVCARVCKSRGMHVIGFLQRARYSFSIPVKTISRAGEIFLTCD
jgi:hypothetical protein